MIIKTFIITLLLTIYLTKPDFVLGQERSINLDPRLGVAHVGSSYPDRHTTQDLMPWGANKAYRLGFNSLEIFIPNNMCFGNNPQTEGSYGPYQAGETFCEPKPSVWTKAKSLTEFVQQPQVVNTFAVPLKRYYLTAYPLNPTFRTARKKELTGIPYTQAELDSLKTEYYDFTKYLLQTYKDNPKVFAIMPMVTMDRWLSGKDLEKDESPGVCTLTDSAPQERIDNMIAYYFTISEAMRQARIDAGTSQSKVYLTCEVNGVICPMQLPTIKAAINSVIPHAGCDLVGLAGYELMYYAWNEHRNDPNYIKQVLDYMASQAPDHPDFGGKNIVISEVGIREQQGTPDTTWFVNTFLSTILKWGAPHVELWALSFCWAFNPSLAQQNDPAICPGWWMFKPDGSLSNYYRVLRDRYQTTTHTPTISPTPTSIATVTPSTSPTPSLQPTLTPTPFSKQGDANNDNKVDGVDYIVWLNHYNQSVTGATNGDFNNSGKVDGVDYVVWLNNYGH